MDDNRNLVRDPRFQWSEPFAFARARARMQKGGSNLVLWGFVVLLCAAALGATDMPNNARDVGLLVLFAAVTAWLVVYPLGWLGSRIPNGIVVASDCIIVGRDTIPLFQLSHAIVGTMEIEGRSFPVLTFRTHDGRDYVYGLGRKVDKVELAAFFERVGVREPR